MRRNSRITVFALFWVLFFSKLKSFPKLNKSFELLPARNIFQKFPRFQKLSIFYLCFANVLLMCYSLPFKSSFSIKIPWLEMSNRRPACTNSESKFCARFAPFPTSGIQVSLRVSFSDVHLKRKMHLQNISRIKKTFFEWDWVWDHLKLSSISQRKGVALGLVCTQLARGGTVGRLVDAKAVFFCSAPRRGRTTFFNSQPPGKRPSVLKSQIALASSISAAAAETRAFLFSPMHVWRCAKFNLKEQKSGSDAQFVIYARGHISNESVPKTKCGQTSAILKD